MKNDSASILKSKTDIFRLIFWVAFSIFLISPHVAYTQTQDASVLKVLVLKNSPPSSSRNERGDLVGFNVDFAELLCASLKVRCVIEETLLSRLFEQLAAGEADFSTVSLTITPERAQKVLFTDPYRRDRTIWISKLLPSQADKAKVAVAAGSQQYRWVEKVRAEQDWSMVPVTMNSELFDALLAGRADAIVVPFENAAAAMNSKGLARLGYNTRVIEAEELSGTIGIAVNPARKELRDQLNNAVHEVKKNGQLDRLNSKYYSFRIF